MPTVSELVARFQQWEEKTEAKDEAAVGVINYEGIEASEAPKGKSAPAIDTDAIAARRKQFQDMERALAEGRMKQDEFDKEVARRRMNRRASGGGVDGGSLEGATLESPLQPLKDIEAEWDEETQTYWFVDQETGSIHYWNEEGQKYAVWDEDCGLRIPPFIVEKLAIGMEDANAAPAEVASTAEVSTGQRGEEQFGLGQTELEQIAKDTGLKLDHLLLFNSGVKCYAFVKSNNGMLKPVKLIYRPDAGRLYVVRRKDDKIHSMYIHLNYFAEMCADHNALEYLRKGSDKQEALQTTVRRKSTDGGGGAKYSRGQSLRSKSMRPFTATRSTIRKDSRQHQLLEQDKSLEPPQPREKTPAECALDVQIDSLEEMPHLVIWTNDSFNVLAAKKKKDLFGECVVVTVIPHREYTGIRKALGRKEAPVPRRSLVFIFDNPSERDILLKIIARTARLFEVKEIKYTVAEDYCISDVEEE